MSFARECKDEIIEELELKVCCKKTFISFFIEQFKVAEEKYFYENYNKKLLNILQEYILIFFELKSIITDNQIFIEKKPYENRLLPASEKSCCQTTFLKAHFLHSGTLTEPKMFLAENKRNNYHLEIKTNEKNGKIIQKVLITRDQINAILTIRRNNIILYIKNKEDIAGFLRLTGAISKASFLEEIIISQFVRATASRKMNCDTANAFKSTFTAARQVKEIQYIKKNRPNNYIIKDEILDLMELRLKYQEKNLSELSEVYAKRNMQISKSCLNHRFRRINKIYLDIKALTSDS